MSMLGLKAWLPRYVCSFVASRKKASCFVVSALAPQKLMEHTHRAAVWSSCYSVILKLEILVEYGGVKLSFPVEAVTDSVPVGCRFDRHVGLQSLFVEIGHSFG